MVVEKDGVFQKVQVKTATWSKSGKFSYLQCRTQTTNAVKRHIRDCVDVLCIVDEHTLWAIPTSEITSTNISLGTTNPVKKPNKWDRYKGFI